MRPSEKRGRGRDIRGGLNPVGGTAAVSRVVLAGLAALASVTAGLPVATELAALALAYLIVALGLWVFQERTVAAWLAYVGVLADVSAATAVMVMAPATLPLWVLYLFAIASAAAFGGAAIVLAAGSSVAASIAVSVGIANVDPLQALWPAAVLIGVSMLLLRLVRDVGVERQAKRAWLRVLAATQPLVTDDEPDAVARGVVGRARRLVEAERAWLWWWDERGGLRGGVSDGPAEEAPPPVGVPSGLLGSRRAQIAPLHALGESFHNREGEVLALRHGGRHVAVLVVEWDKPEPRNLYSRRRQLRALASWAAEQLATAWARAAAREALRREQAIRRAAAELAATLDGEVALRSLLSAATHTLSADTWVVEEPSGAVLAGRAPSAGAGPGFEVRSEREVSEPQAGDSQTQPAPAGDVARRLMDGVSLRAWRAEGPFAQKEIAWLDELASLGARALDRCLAHEQLTRAEQQLRETLERLPAPIVVRDSANQPVLVNAAYLGLDLGDVVGETQVSGDGREREVVVEEPPRTFIVTSVPLSVANCQVSLYREVTRERDALRAKDEMVAQVGHELRTPLTAIRGYSDLMMRQLKVVQDQIARLNLLITDMMEASLLQSGQLHLDRQTVPVAELVRAAVDRFRARVAGRVIRDEIPELRPVWVDPSRFGQVLDNLLDNAAKYSPGGEEIVVTAESEEREVRVAVRDSGVGIEPEYLPKLFDRFYRAPQSEKTPAPGFGLGLSIVRDLVAAHGGRVWAESPGSSQGSTFWVAIPLAEEDEIGDDSTRDQVAISDRAA